MYCGFFSETPVLKKPGKTIIVLVSDHGLHVYIRQNDPIQRRKSQQTEYLLYSNDLYLLLENLFLNVSIILSYC